jgi:hypothetical protein
VNNKYDVNAVSLFRVTYLITPMIYLFSQWTPNVQFNYFMFDWSIYGLFELKCGLEAWISPNNYIRIYLTDRKHGSIKNSLWFVNKKTDVNDVRLFTFFIYYHLWLTCAPNEHLVSKSNILYLIGGSTENLC